MTIRTPQRMVMACAAAALIALAAAPSADGQIRYDRGQNVGPVFEGWERNPDGTFNMVFGYMNRNYQEMPEAPVGGANFFEPGPADRGQPTRFYPRRQQFVVRVQVPADWGEQDLVWTVTTNGRTDKAFGRLWLAWELDDGVIRGQPGHGAPGPPHRQPAPVDRHPRWHGPVGDPARYADDHRGGRRRRHPGAEAATGDPRRRR